MNGDLSYFHRSISRMAFLEHVVNGQKERRKEEGWKIREEKKKKKGEEKDEDAFIFSLCGISG